MNQWNWFLKLCAYIYWSYERRKVVQAFFLKLVSLFICFSIIMFIYVIVLQFRSNPQARKLLSLYAQAEPRASFHIFICFLNKLIHDENFVASIVLSLCLNIIQKKIF
jgi:hypothetical protein